MRHTQAPSVTRKLVNKIRLPEWNDTRKLSIINDLSGEYMLELNAATQGRIALLKKIKDCTNAGGYVAMWIFSRDCDMCESFTCRIVPAKEVHDYIDDLYASAEGPVSYTIHHPSEPFSGYCRDRVLEAFEDGHPHVVYCN